MTEISTDDIECFSDYMALWIPKSHIHGLKQWLSRTLNVPVNWKSMERLNSFLARCGYFLHPDSAGNYIFQAHYTACFVQQEKSNYLLEIKIFQKGIKSFGQSYILKCPVITSKVRQVSILCGPDTIQVSRPIPQGNASRQNSWLLSLRGELMASLEDASLLGLYVEANSTAISILGPRHQLLQRKEVMNTSVDFLSLWMVNGYLAYSLEAMCPLVLSQPGPEVLVQIPKQGLGLVKRGSRYTEALTLRDLRVSQSNSFMVTENRDYVVVSIPASAVLRSQQCQEGQGAHRMQSFYRLDLSLEFAEVAGPVRWTVENFFHCADQPSSSGVKDPESFSAEVSPSINKHLSASHVPGTEELKSDLPSSLTILNTVPSSQPSSPALPPSTLSVGIQPASSFSLQAAGSASSEGLQKEPFGSFALDSGQREQAPGTSPVPCLQLNIFSNSPEEYSASTRSRSTFSLGCLIPSNPTAPSNSTSPTLGASTSAIVSFQESSGDPKNLQSKGATLTALPSGFWLHSPALNHDKRRPSGIPMTVPSNEGSPKSEKPPEATEKIPKDVSKAIVSGLSDTDQDGQAFLQMSTTLAAGQNDSPRHPGFRGTSAVLSKNFSGGIIHHLFSFTTHSSKKEQEFLMKPQAVSVGISQDSVISSVPGTMINQQGTKDLTNEGIALLPPSVMFQDDSTPSSVTTGDHSQALQLTHPAPTTAGQHYSVPALPQLVSFGSTKFLGSLMHLQKAFTIQTDGLREIRPEQDLAQLPEHPNQLRKLMEGTDVSLQLENGWVSAGLQGGNHLAGEYLATTLTGGKADSHHGHNQTQKAAVLQGLLFPTSEITVANQRDSHFLQNRAKGIFFANLLLSGPEEAGQPSLQTEPQNKSPLSWRDVAYTNREGVVLDSTVTHQEWPKTDGPTSPVGHMLKSQRAFGQASIHPFLLPRWLSEKELSNPQRRTLEGIRRSTVASTEGDRKQLSKSFEGIRTEGPGSMPAGTGGWVITPTYSLWPSQTLHPESYLSQVTEAASSSISNPGEPGDPFSTGY